MTINSSVSRRRDRPSRGAVVQQRKRNPYNDDEPEHQRASSSDSSGSHDDDDDDDDDADDNKDKDDDNNDDESSFTKQRPLVKVTFPTCCGGMAASIQSLVVDCYASYARGDCDGFFLSRNSSSSVSDHLDEMTTTEFPIQVDDMADQLCEDDDHGTEFGFTQATATTGQDSIQPRRERHPSPWRVLRTEPLLQEQQQEQQQERQQEKEQEKQQEQEPRKRKTKVQSPSSMDTSHYPSDESDQEQSLGDNNSNGFGNHHKEEQGRYVSDPDGPLLPRRQGLLLSPLGPQAAAYLVDEYNSNLYVQPDNLTAAAHPVGSSSRDDNHSTYFVHYDDEIDDNDGHDKVNHTNNNHHTSNIADLHHHRLLLLLEEHLTDEEDDDLNENDNDTTTNSTELAYYPREPCATLFRNER